MYDAINRGWRLATDDADVIAHLNCDEQYLPGALGIVADYFSNHWKIDVALADMIVVNDDGGYICHRRSLRPNRFLSRICCVGMTTTTFQRASVVQDKRIFFDPSWRNIGDMVWYNDLFRAGVRFGVFNELVAVFADTGQNLNLTDEAVRERKRYADEHLFGFKKITRVISKFYSFRHDLSTYTSHLRNMKQFALKAGKKSLVLIDEFGTGTEPRMGGAIAEAVLEHLNQKQCFGVITTHYTNLKILADKTPGLINGAMLFDTRRMQPLFSLQTGNPGSSFAFEMAKKTGLPWYILRNAEKKVGKTEVKFDKQLQQLEVEKREVTDKQKELSELEKRLGVLTNKYENLKTEIETNKARIIKDARKEAQQIVDNSNKLIENTIREIREAQADKEKTKALRKKLNEQKIDNQGQSGIAPKKIPTAKTFKPLREKATTDSKTILVGNRVRIPPQSTVGEVVELTGKEALVSFGSVIMKVPMKKLINVGEEEYHEKILFRKKSYGNIINELNDKMANFKLSLDLRGQRAEEASAALQHYIDEALLLSIKEVKILHGKGNGILREVIRDQLRLIPEVKRFGDEKIEMGGTGITVVLLK